MKPFKLIFIFSFLTLEAFAQKGKFEWSIDTLEAGSDKSLVYYETYKDSILVGSVNAYFYPITYSVPRFCAFYTCILGGVFKKEISADSIVLHGSTKHWRDGNYRIGKYEHGEKIEMTYFDSEGNEISYQDYYGNWKSQWDPEKGTGLFFSHGRKKKNK